MALRARGWEEPEPPERLVEDLERRLQGELRAEQEAYEELAAIDLLRSRNLADVALELLARGDVVAVRLAAGVLTGTVVYAAGDLAVVRTGGIEADVNLRAPLVLTVVERVADGGRSRGDGPPSFKARLFEHEAAGTRLVLWTRPPDATPPGVLAAVAVDHVVVDTDAGRRYLALAALDAVRPVV